MKSRPNPISRLISLTRKGTDLLRTCQVLTAKAAEMVFGQLPPADIAHCQRLLQPTEQRHSQLVGTLRGKPFEAMYAEVMKKA